MRNMLQFVARLLCVAAFLCLGSGGVWAQADRWDGTTIATQFAGGTGVSGNPYQIATAAQLAYLAQQVNGGNNYDGKYFQLTNDIDLNNHDWIVIGGSFSSSFSGFFDGKGNTISNLGTNPDYNNYDKPIGLFPCVAGATIENLTVIISNIGLNQGCFVGGIAGSVEGNTTTTIKNCCVLGGPINAYHPMSDAAAGGIVGAVNSSEENFALTISFCCANVSNITSTVLNGQPCIVGGIIGFNRYDKNITIQNCASFTTNMKYSSDYDYNCEFGGILGKGSATTLSNNYSNPLCLFTKAIINEHLTEQSSTTTKITGGESDNANGAALTTENSKPDGAAFTDWAVQGWTLAEGKLPKISSSAPDILVKISIGAGTEPVPYLITSAADLEYVAILINSGAVGFNSKEYYRLENDIDLESKEWTAIGTSANPFKGNFDGDNKTITLGIKADANQSQAGLFGTIDKGAKVEKLAVHVTSEGITATASAAPSNAGAIAAINIGTINQCYVTGGGFLSANGNKSYAGGIAGSNSGTISNCYNLIPVKVDEGATAHAGGIVGHNIGTVEKCFASCEVSTAEKTHATEEAAGGIVGFNDDASSTVVSNCVAVNSKVAVNAGTNAHRVIGTGGNDNDVNNFSHHEMSLVTKATNTYDPLEGTALTKYNANSATGGCFYGWEAAAWNLDAIGTSLPKLKGFDGQKDISIASYLLYTVTINSVSNGTLTVTRPAPLNTGGSSITVNNGDQVPYNTELSITATPASGYELDQLTVGTKKVSSNTTTHQVTDNVTVSATFKEIPKYTVIINPPSNGTISITYPDPTGAKITVNTGDNVMRDIELTITATPASGYKLKTLTVNGNNFTNGTTHRVAGDVTVEATFEAESVDPDPVDPDPTPTPPQPTVYYTVTLPSVEGAATDPVAGEHEVESWSNFRFSLTLDSAYNQSVPVVTTDRGETLTPRQSDGAYILNQVRSDVEIYISGIVKNPDPVANEAIASPAALPRIWTEASTLCIGMPPTAPASTPVYVLTADGRLWRTLSAAPGLNRQTLPQGFYIVRVDDVTRKVIVR